MSDQEVSPTSTDLRQIAENATTKQWKPYFNVHGDPYVTLGAEEFEHRELMNVVANVSTGPDDYGRANAIFMGTFDPATVLAMLDVIDAADRGTCMCHESVCANSIHRAGDALTADRMRFQCSQGRIREALEKLRKTTE